MMYNINSCTGKYNLSSRLKLYCNDLQLFNTFMFLWDKMTQHTKIIYFILQVDDKRNNKKNLNA